MQLFRLAVPALLLLPLALACSDDDGAGPDSPSVATVVVEPDSSGLLVSQTLQLTAIALSAAGDTLDAEVSWSSGDPSVVEVEAGGQVLGLAPGRAEVRAAAGEVVGTAVVTVEAPTLTVSPRSTGLPVGGTLELTARVTGAADPRVSWLSGDTTLARVAADGVVTGEGAGAVFVHASLLAHPTVRDSASLMVGIGPFAPRIEPAEPMLDAGDEIVLQAINFAGPVTWESSNSQVASVDSAGVLKGIASGTALITARGVENPDLVASTTATVFPPHGPSVSIAAIEGPNGESVDPQNLSGDIVVVVNLNAPASSGVAEAMVLVDSTVAARRSYTGGSEQWRAPVDTRAFANGSHEISAQLLNANGDVIATASNVHVTFAN